MARKLFGYALLTLLTLTANAEALSRHVGRHYYVIMMASNHKFPIFTKEFSEGEGINTIGGFRDLWLQDTNRTTGVRVGYDTIGSNRTGFGLGMTYWRTEFENEAFRYDSVNFQRKIAEYRVPTHSYLFLDFSWLFLPWVSGWRGVAVYGMVSAVGDWEKYYIDKYTLALDGSELDRVSEKRSNFDLNLGLGLAARIHFSRRWSLWMEKRWIRGEKYGLERSIEEGGFFFNDQQRTLYAPINSIGLALGF